MTEHLAPARPEDHFFAPRPAVSIVSVGDTLEALNLRSALESLHASVTLHLPGTPADFLRVLAQEPAPKYLIICAHGTESGLVFGEYIPEEERQNQTLITS